MPKLDGFMKCRIRPLIGRLQHVPSAPTADHDAEGDRPELVVGVEQHVDRERGDVRRQQERRTTPPGAVAREARACAAVAQAAIISMHDLRGVADGQREERPGPRLLEAEHGVAEDVEDAHGDREVAQREVARVAAVHPGGSGCRSRPSRRRPARLRRRGRCGEFGPRPCWSRRCTSVIAAYLLGLVGRASGRASPGSGQVCWWRGRRSRRAS